MTARNPASGAVYAGIVKLLEANTGTRRLGSVFDDFTEMAALAFRNAAFPSLRETREKQYLRIAAQYTPEQMRRFSEVLALVTLAMQNDPRDVLGTVYMQLGLGNERLGQFFTPYDLAELVTGLTFGDEAHREVRRDGFTTLHEPACGAGAFLIAATQAMRRAGMNYQTQLHVTCEDVAATAVHMVYIHLSLLHVPALVYRRDTLSGSTFEVWPTLAHVMGGWSTRLQQAKRALST